MKTTLLLIRHGQSIANAEHRFAGHADFPLSELGIRQAQACAEALSDTPIDAIYASDLSRAYETANAHAKRRGLVPIKNEGLREMFCGAFEGVPVPEIAEKYPELFPDKWENDYMNFVFPDGESVRASGERFGRTLAEIARVEGEKTVLIGTHAGVIRAFYAEIAGISDEECSKNLPFPTNASVTTVTYDGESFAPVSYSVNDYLDDTV